MKFNAEFYQGLLAFFLSKFNSTQSEAGRSPPTGK